MKRPPTEAALGEIAVKAVIQFYRRCFLLGAHAAAAVWAFFAVKLAIEGGHVVAALTFAVLSGIMTSFLIVWWSKSTGKLGHRDFQNRPLRLETGQHRIPKKNILRTWNK